ncbi:MAG: DUF1330 domain-containing protein [Roseiarcus sp.]
MAKGYWIANMDVREPEAYKAYIAAAAPVFAEFGARFLVRAGRHEVAQGASGPRQVVIEFPDYASALACYHSPRYQAAKALRASISDGDHVIAEGYDGPQPG